MSRRALGSHPLSKCSAGPGARGKAILFYKEMHLEDDFNLGLGGALAGGAGGSGLVGDSEEACGLGGV
ncbi:hypothetical protein E2562_001045 [Oryza meyeriana var. granulata]|uniref:Uncharacterized protein n=1 Tax=Oryza meyeriana var. granulata TaxID=110450 RepID=A0A6G1ED25_9ORYZ|nr:hypothetical protein E2562_001045 [Oryza meyeriana var. granulata]